MSTDNSKSTESITAPAGMTEPSSLNGVKDRLWVVARNSSLCPHGFATAVALP